MDFSKVKLKKTQTKAVDHSLDVGAGDALATLQERVRQMDLDAWYDRFRDHTFETVFVPLSVADGKAFVDAQKRKDPSSVESLPCVEALGRAIDGFPNREAFVKLSSRSPKDATVSSGRTRRLFKEYCTHDADDNSKLIAINRAHIEALRVTSAAEALALLLASERILDDLELALEFPATWSQQLVVRRWSPVALDGEFRGFVFGGRLTALSQYYVPCFFESLQDATHRARVVAQCTALVDAVRAMLPKNANECAVVDFLSVDNGAAVKIIEMNPFNDYSGCGTSAALFDWVKDASTLCGASPFEFRWVRAPEPNIRALLGVEWRSYFNE